MTSIDSMMKCQSRKGRAQEEHNERTDHVWTTSITIDPAVYMEVVQRNGLAVVTAIEVSAL